ncbi:PerC family transcriptional regulator [Enterobacter ludwigii]
MDEEKAITLEKKGMWRRAARCWLDLQSTLTLSDSERELLIKNQQRCVDRFKNKGRSKPS